MGEVVTGKSGNLEVGDLVEKAAILSPQSHEPGEVKVHTTAVNKGGFGLIVAGVVAHADEIIVQAVGWGEEQPSDARQGVRPHTAGRRRCDYRFTGELVNIGLNVCFAEEGIEISLCVPGVTIVALDGEPRVQVIAIAQQKAAAFGGVVRDIDAV